MSVSDDISNPYGEEFLRAALIRARDFLAHEGDIPEAQRAAALHVMHAVYKVAADIGARHGDASLTSGPNVLLDALHHRQSTGGTPSMFEPDPEQRREKAPDRRTREARKLCVVAVRHLQQGGYTTKDAQARVIALAKTSLGEFAPATGSTLRQWVEDASGGARRRASPYKADADEFERTLSTVIGEGSILSIEAISALFARFGAGNPQTPA